MQVILSRKGFDSKNGGQPSPIMPDGTLLSLPIRSIDDTIHFADLKYKDKTYLAIIQELNPNTKIKEYYTCHLDPDLRKEVIKRGNGWNPLFGQHSSSQAHLSNEKVKAGDLFLFFGWFKETEWVNGVLRYKRNVPDKHLIFGYLQIGEIHQDMSKLPKEYQYHPHTQGRFLKDNKNCIYKATDTLSLIPDLNGAGCLKYHSDLVLTKKGCKNKSHWTLPSFFRDVKMSYHTKESFTTDYFQAAKRGQEFVIEENENVIHWAKNIIMIGARHN